ncbi:MAG: polysaccharide export protein [Gammaproteobacteria bacterium]|nr:polysaccharide export protein [Gammaproteobacteria bacterium]
MYALNRYSISILGLVAVWVAQVWCTDVSMAQTAKSGGVATGDTVSVVVYGEPELNVTGAKVKGNGTIVVPLIGDVRVAGLSAEEVRTRITELFADGYLKKPIITVDVEKFQLYYIKGQVRKPGGYRFKEGLSVEKAIALAGGFTERASETDIRLNRENGKAVTGKIPVSTVIVPGDVITVGESFF